MKLTLLLIFLFLPLSGSILAGVTVETIYYGGPILTMNDDQLRVEAVAVGEGKVLAVGSSDEIMKLKGKKTQTINLKGQAMIPGFVDAHGHVLVIGLQALSANMLPAPATRKNSGIPHGLIKSRMDMTASLLSALLMCQSMSGSKGFTT